MPATLRDVAHHAGVSPTTVLRALNSNAEISSSTRQMVEASVQALGYLYRSKHGLSRTDKRAEAAGSRTTTLTLLFPDKTRTTTNAILTGELVHGIEPVVRRNNLAFTMTEINPDGSMPAHLSSMNVAGLMIRRPLLDIHREFERRLPNLPIVWLFQPYFWPEVGDVVQPDNVVVGRIAARWLIDRGHTRFVALRFLDSHVETKVRVDSFVAELESLGHATTVVDCNSAHVREHLRLSGDSNVPKTGYFLPVGESDTDVLYKLLRSTGQVYGQDFDIVSCNSNAERLHLLDRRLPNIDIRPYEMGHVAVESLLWRIANRNAPQQTIFVKPTLVEGECD